MLYVELDQVLPLCSKRRLVLRNPGTACSPGRALNREKQSTRSSTAICACAQRIRAVPVLTTRSTVRPHTCYCRREIAMWKEILAEVGKRGVRLFLPPLIRSSC
eukprot:IDg3372t1